MLKRDEVFIVDSCLNKADEDEMIFVLLARDESAADAVEFWARRRVERGKNQPNDPKIVKALNCAARMREQFLDRNKPA